MFRFEHYKIGITTTPLKGQWVKVGVLLEFPAGMAILNCRNHSQHIPYSIVAIYCALVNKNTDHMVPHSCHKKWFLPMVSMVFVWLLETKILHVILSLGADIIKLKLFRSIQTGHLMMSFGTNSFHWMITSDNPCLSGVHILGSPLTKLTRWPLGYVAGILKVQFSNSGYQLSSWALVKSFSGECHWTLSMISQCWLRFMSPYGITKSQGANNQYA